MLKVLIIDDSRAVHAFLKGCLPPQVAEIHDAMNGEEGLKALDQLGADYDLVLLDWEMPVLDGPSTLRAIRERGDATPVLMMTTRSSVDDVKLVLELGVNEYMFKPFTKDILFEKMAIALGREVSNVA